MLRLAARHADIVGLLPAPIRDPDGAEDPRDRLPAAFDAKLAVLREAAGDRFAGLEINALATFIITGRRRAETEDLIARNGWSGIDADGSGRCRRSSSAPPTRSAPTSQARRERFGLSYLVAGQDCMPALTTIISGL